MSNMWGLGREDWERDVVKPDHLSHCAIKLALSNPGGVGMWPFRELNGVISANSSALNEKKSIKIASTQPYGEKMALN